MNKLFLVLLAFSTATFAEEIKVIPKKGNDYYAWITQLSIGPYQERKLTQQQYEELPNEDERGFKYRAAVITAEIYSGLYIEKIVVGSEGCCVRINSIYTVDLDDFSKKFNLIGEIAGLKVLDWKNPTNFIFSIHGRKFEASVIVKNGTIKILETKGS